MRLLRWLSAGYVAAVLVVTLWPSPESTDAPGWATAVLDALTATGLPITLPVLEALANVVMFLPFGVLGYALVRTHDAGRLPRRERSPLAVVGAVTAAGLLFSAAIETTQLALPGRVSTLQDVVVNTLGAALGAAGTAVVLALVSRRYPAGQPTSPST